MATPSNGWGGYQPRTTPAERRAFFDLQRRLAKVEAEGGGGGGEGVDEVWISNAAPTDPEIELWYDPDAVVSDPALGFSFLQAVAASTWVIDHPLGFQPNVTITDTAGDQVEGDVQYTTPSRVTITFSAPFPGIAYLS